MSRIALAPAETTMTGVRASSSRSAEMSKLFSAPLVHAADAAGGEDLDAGEVRRDHRCGDRGAAGAPFGQREGQIGARQLERAGRLGQPFDAAPRDSPILSRPSTTAIGRRHRAFGRDLGLDGGGHRCVVRVGHAVGDDGAFQRHHRRLGLKRRGDRRIEVDEGMGGRAHGALMPRPRGPAQAPAPPPAGAHRAAPRPPHFPA